MPMKDVLLIPDSRARQSRMTGIGLLEQHMKYLATIQRRNMSEKKGDLDALTSTITRLAISITQAVRLHHQISREDGDPDNLAAALVRYIDFDDTGQPEQEAP